MATESNDEKKFKQCIQLIINAVSDTINNSQGQTNSQQLLNDLRKTIKIILEKSLSSLSSHCRNYLLDILHQYHYDDATDQTLSEDTIESFLHDLQGRLESLDIFQGAWNDDQSIVEQFIENYPELKDKSGLYETTLLYSAARNNHFDLVTYLIEEVGCSVNAQNEEYFEKGHQIKATIGSTPLHAACYQGHLHIVKYLSSHGGDYYILNNAKETPIQNGKLKSNIRKFFEEFLVFGYSTNLSNILKRKILHEIEASEELITDCIWEYKPLAMEQWMSFNPEIADELQQALINQPFETQIRLKTGRDRFSISVAKFLRLGPNPDQPKSSAWIRCRGSSLLNFRCYSQWQMMFIKHPTGTINPSPSLEILDMTSNDNIQFNSWYTIDDQMNLIFETAMNYRRRYVNIYLEILEDEKITFNLETFSFMNEQQTIAGFVRWIPKLISDTTDLTPLNNFQLFNDSNIMLLTRSCVKQAYENENISSEEMQYYFELTYENVFQDDDLEFSNKVRLFIK
jgi:hypothetical protein